VPNRPILRVRSAASLLQEPLDRAQEGPLPTPQTETIMPGLEKSSRSSEVPAYLRHLASALVYAIAVLGGLTALS
jgi:hypothetical protein